MKQIVVIVIFFLFLIACKQKNSSKTETNNNEYGLLTKTVTLYKDIGLSQSKLGNCAKGNVVALKKKDMLNKKMWYEIVCGDKQGWFQLKKSKELIISNSIDFLKSNKDKYLKKFK